jgi:hypothetical protein
MKRRTALFVVLGALIFISASGLTVFFAYRTFSTMDERAVTAMNAEELTALHLLSSVNRNMSSDQVFRTLGSPSEDLHFLAKWNGFGGSVLSQARVYFAGGRPTKVRWMKLGFFVYEKHL